MTPGSAFSERIEVGGRAPYAVTVGYGVADQLAASVQADQRVAMIHGTAPQSFRERAQGRLRRAGHEVTAICVPDGESGKSLDVARRCWDALGASGFTRSDVIIALGGGAVTDLAGFVAATWLRGVRLINVPTTLLGMVDAAVGGKTAINVAAGKNLVGAFHPPVAVIADLDVLDTLPDPEYRSGLAEVVKCGFIADPVILDLLDRDPSGRVDQAELVVRAVRVKAEVVAEDLTDLGRREMLNYGHTLGHAIESASRYSMRHGEAISIGMVFAAQLARHAGLLDRASAARHRELISAMGLPTTCSAAWSDLLVRMRVDKKARGDQLRFVVLEDIARPRILESPEEALLESAYADLMKG
ncbi:MAG: 3-dehydroquinate synthase [Actinomycetota bacterium]|nr:3-dehydroquinate synthase [Actinomycetota bacterium]